MSAPNTLKRFCKNIVVFKNEFFGKKAECFFHTRNENGRRRKKKTIMAKTGKRILAVVLLILTVLLVGCLVFTGNRLANYPDNLDGYKRVVFEGKDNTMVAFTDKNVWYAEQGEDMVLVEVESYIEGVITLLYGEEKLQFIAIDKNTLYCPESEQFLIKRGDG